VYGSIKEFSTIVAEAINCASYTLNHTSINVVMNVNPKESWSNIKYDVSHFKVFGCETWTHIPNEKHKEMKLKVSHIYLLAMMKM